MAFLRDIKNRIKSTSSTLKITSAMKLIASSKLHKVQNNLSKATCYQSKIEDVFRKVISDYCIESKTESLSDFLYSSETLKTYFQQKDKINNIAIVSFSSNSSLCGDFNSKVIKKTKQLIHTLQMGEDISEKSTSDCCKKPIYLDKNLADITVFSVGRKMTNAIKKINDLPYISLDDIAHNVNLEEVRSLSQQLTEAFLSGKFDKVILLYSHYKNLSSVEILQETFLPLSNSISLFDSTITFEKEGKEVKKNIIEPDYETLFSNLVPEILICKLHTVILDNLVSEHASRMLAMQSACENAEDLLSELNLQYNKSRQQKITNELLDIVSSLNSSE